jgi:hypothetical protein
MKHEIVVTGNSIDDDDDDHDLKSIMERRDA